MFRLLYSESDPFPILDLSPVKELRDGCHLTRGAETAYPSGAPEVIADF